MAASIGDWHKYIENIYNHTSPGGFVEFQDYEPMYASDDGSLRPEHNTYKWISTLLEASRKNNREPNPGPLLESWLREAGFVNVRHYQMKVPVGPWPKHRTLVRTNYLLCFREDANSGHRKKLGCSTSSKS
jgi:hypothetical protein